MALPKSAAPVAAAHPPPASGPGPRRSVLFYACAFAVIADPASSVAHVIEAALRGLHGDLALLLPTMSLVVGLVVIVAANHWQLAWRFPKGGWRGRPRPGGRSARTGSSCPSARWSSPSS